MLDVTLNSVAVGGAIVGFYYGWRFYRRIGYGPLVVLPIGMIFAIVGRGLRLARILTNYPINEELIINLFCIFWILLAIGLACLYRAAKRYNHRF